MTKKMPAWWGRKSHKSSKAEQNEQVNPHNISKGSEVKDDKKKGKEKPKSFDEVSAIFIARKSARTSKEFVISGGGSSFGSDSDGHVGVGGGGGCGGGGVAEKRGHPLPRPSVSSSPSLEIDHGVGSVSGSVSSISSSGSDDSTPDLGLFGGYRAYGETKFNQTSRSPGPGSRAATPSTPSSPLHPRMFGMSLESQTGKQEDGRSICHPLPLPPGSPTNPCASPSRRSSGTFDSSLSLRSKWKKGKLLGRGTFGHVYLGFNSESGHMCAIKEVRVVSDDQTSRECLKQLNQEISLLSQLSHPNIVQYYGSELGEERLSVYLEYVSGGSIHKLLQEYGSFREPVIQNYTRQILSGLVYLHGRNHIHRDIKGANILVDPNGEIKLADFGMAKHITSYSTVLSFKGSPYWMAPEVIMNCTKGYSLAVDIWSLGCTILEMATSKPPWSQYEGVAAMFKIGNSKDIPEIPNHLSSDAKSFLNLCLQRDPAARPTAAQLLDHPFVRDTAAARANININTTHDALPSSFEGSHTRTVSELPFNRTNVTSLHGDYGMKQVVTSSRAFKSSRDSVRLNVSLPVSPCSSPLRNHGTANRSYFLSPPHPSYPFGAQSGYGPTDYSALSTRPNTNFPTDAWWDNPQPRTTTPGGSPRRLYRGHHVCEEQNNSFSGHN
ncbi:PREDICTED: mitogen-activated protein kinase kinase kinase YODA-like isoform X2 [Nelumbo nucifera]|uniref:mitogen-activated protein kinase kinase kinase n=1 Tax=Nelumbo nucifera TaxID=4432 RepID=A0A1U8A2L9_NELNU|nr:PREDICTED: mitogen-activated protein kinase kinase kinase YODA-like isoform X2 [Nelumbo nucifera]